MKYKVFCDFVGGKKIKIDMKQVEAAARKVIADAEKEKKRRPRCKWCKSIALRALNNNGIFGPGYAEWNFACRKCGRVQP